MRIICVQCQTQYTIAEEKLGARGAKVKCKRCGTFIVVKPNVENSTAQAENGDAALPAANAHEAPGATPISSPTIILGDTTAVTADVQPTGAWYVAIDNQQVGPMNLEELTQRAASGEVHPGSLVWKAGMADWLALASVPELQPAMAALQQSVSSPTSQPTSSVVSSPQQAAAPKAKRDNAAAADNSASNMAPVTWKPSAASALSSLVQEELLAAAQPAKITAPHGMPALNTPQISADDVFGGQIKGPPPPAAVAQAAAADWSTPAPRSSRVNPTVLLAVGLGGVLLLAGIFAWKLLTPPPPPPPSVALLQKATPVAEPPAAAAAPPRAAVAPPPPAAAPASATRERRPVVDKKLRSTAAAASRAAKSRPPPVEARARAAPPPAAAPAVKAALARDDIWSVVRSNASKMAPCLKAARARNEIAAGSYTFKLDWVILPNGAVSEAQLKGPDTALAGSLPSCFAAVLGQWHFPASQNGVPVHNFPFGPVNLP